MSSETTFSGGSAALAVSSRPFVGAGLHGWTRPDGRRTLQLVLATIWLIDGILQLQSFFFTKSFGLQMISGMSQGNPSVIARPITWSGTTIGHHAVLTDACFAVVQTAIAVAIAWRPTVKIGLAVSIAWSVGVWWVGEGLGGVLNGTANPVNGAPGAVMIYALLAVLLWPIDRRRPARLPFIAARAVGVPIAKALWFVLWGSLSYFAVLGVNRSSQGLHNLITAEANGEPGWVAWIDHHAASLVGPPWSGRDGGAGRVVAHRRRRHLSAGVVGQRDGRVGRRDRPDLLGGRRELRSAASPTGPPT